MSALIRTACSLTLRAPDALLGEGTEAVQSQSEMLKRLCLIARHLRSSAEKVLAKELDGWEKRLRALPGATTEASDDLASEVLVRMDAGRKEWAATVGSSLGLAAPSRAVRAGRSAALAESGESDSDDEDEAEDSGDEE